MCYNYTGPFRHMLRVAVLLKRYLRSVRVNGPYQLVNVRLITSRADSSDT